LPEILNGRLEITLRQRARYIDTIVIRGGYQYLSLLLKGSVEDPNDQKIDEEKVSEPNGEVISAPLSCSKSASPQPEFSIETILEDPDDLEGTYESPSDMLKNMKLDLTPEGFSFAATGLLLGEIAAIIADSKALADQIEHMYSLTRDDFESQPEVHERWVRSFFFAVWYKV
jgi:hypothetical protein